MTISNKSLVAVTLSTALLSIGHAAFAATATTTMTVDTALTTACEVSGTPAIDFGSLAALESTGNKVAGSGTTFQVACSNSALPTIYSATTRELANGANTLAFKLSLDAAATTDLGADSGAASTLTITQNGSLQSVPVYAKILAADYKGLPSGSYTATVTLVVSY